MEKFQWPREVFGKNCFGDLNIPQGPKSREICEAAISLGYKILALNTPVVATSCLPKNAFSSGGGGKKGKKRKLEERTGGTLSATAAQAGYSSQGCVPKVNKPEWIKELMEKHEDIRILTRLTVIFYDVSHLQAVFSQENSSSYDILACVPTNHDALVSCIIATNFTFDIITFDIEGPHWINKVKLNRQKGKVAAERDVFFEVTYSPSFHGDEPLENLVYIGNRLTEDICTRRVKNIIISSGAASAEELRSPKDVIGLGYLLDLDETTARSSFRENVERIVQKADARKFGKSWVAFVPGEKKAKTGIVKSI